ncbi:MAG: methyltransferase domain-containing protein [Acidobacteria bacterium]|nr:methyltransferase domain-containing protein [Acidobacteriota bacterium]MBK8147527.1 methyltransferase domain-containing protein [Acidobacteriota bacterium]MBK8813934.1 methyltransferase domain-containing protein [Acidobacteriota bacterium]
MVYDKIAERYDRLMAPLERNFLKRWREETLSLLPLNSRILEIGAGTGANFAYYPPAACAVASEISAEMIGKARSRSAGISLIRANVESLPFSSGSFDAAFATLVFCSVANPTDGFNELRRVVRPGGRIVLLEHVRPNGLLGYLFDLFNIVSMALIEDRFNQRTSELAENSGLKIVELRRKALGAVNLIVCEN